MAALVLIVMSVVGGYIYLQKLRRRQTGTTTPAHVGISMSEMPTCTVDAPISMSTIAPVPMDMRPNDAALAAAAAESQTHLSHEGVQPQMKGRFDIYTGKENPKFDPETGVQNW